MPANTADGWPYVLPADHPLEYPALSQQLADLLDQRWDTWQASDTPVWSSPWGDPNIRVTKHAGMVTVQLAAKPTADVALAPTSTVTMATLSVGFRPGVPLTGNGAGLNPSGNNYAPAILWVDNAGQVRIKAFTATTIVANTGVVYGAITFRQGG